MERTPVAGAGWLNRPAPTGFDANPATSDGPSARRPRGSNTRHVVSMGIIRLQPSTWPRVTRRCRSRRSAVGAVPVVVTTVLAVLTVVGLRILGVGGSEGCPALRRALRLRRRLIEQSPSKAVAWALFAPTAAARPPHPSPPTGLGAGGGAGRGCSGGHPGLTSTSRQLGSGGGLPPADPSAGPARTTPLSSRQGLPHSAPSQCRSHSQGKQP
jgi:hypothetical protein